MDNISERYNAIRKYISCITRGEEMDNSMLRLLNRGRRNREAEKDRETDIGKREKRKKRKKEKYAGEKENAGNRENRIQE